MIASGLTTEMRLVERSKEAKTAIPARHTQRLTGKSIASSQLSLWNEVC